MELHPGQELSEISKVDKPWDGHKADNGVIGALYAENPLYLQYGSRMGDCAPLLRFGEIAAEDVAEHDRRIKLQKAKFCRVRLCPVCVWRKSLALKARFLANWEEAGYKEACEGFAYIHLVFTVQNPPMAELRQTIKQMNDGFKKLLKRKEVLPVVKGFIKSTEVTRGKGGNPHPHFHVTCAVNPSYFTDRTYISQAKWVALWRECLGLDYDPVVSVKRVRDRRKNRKEEEDDLAAALVETVKYSVKASDFISADSGGYGPEKQIKKKSDKEYLYGLTEQIKALHFLSSGGCFAGIFKNPRKADDEVSDNEMLLKNTSNEDETDGLVLTFGWDGKKNYRLRGVSGKTRTPD